MSVVEPDPIQAAEEGIKLPTEEMKAKQALLEAGQPVESGVEASVGQTDVKPNPKPRSTKKNEQKRSTRSSTPARPKEPATSGPDKAFKPER